MKRISVVLVMSLALIVSGSGPAAADPPGDGTVETLISYDSGLGQLPEGVAVDKRGRIYISMPFIGELRRIDTDGSDTLVTNMPTAAQNQFGPLGLAVDGRGDVYVADVTFDEATHGVWRVTPAGAKTRLPGTGAIAFPNGVAFDESGTLYITDSIGGAVWRIRRGGVAELWIQSALLTGDDSAPLPFPIGANGITYRLGTIYVTNTELASVVAIPINADGSAGTPWNAAQGAALGGADGVAPDVHGDLYVAVIGQSTIVRVDQGDGSITPVATGTDGLDYASSVAFGSSRDQRSTLYAVNFAVGPFFGDQETHGPGLLAIDLDVPGSPQP